MIYLLALCVILFAVIYYDFTYHKKHIKIYFYITILFLTFISGFSYRLGSDVINYMYEYNNTKTLGDVSFNYIFSSYDRQCGWQLLNSTIKTISSSFVVFKIIHSFMVNMAVGIFIYKYFKYKFIALLCFYFFIYIPFNFEILRESLAVSCFLFSIQFFIERKYLKYYLCVILAFSFHISAVILFILPVLKLFTNTKKGLVIILSLCLMSLLFISQIQQLFYYLIFIPSIANKAIAYFSSETYGASRFSVTNIINYIFNIIIPVLLLIKVKKDNYVYKFSPLIIANVIIYCLSMHISIFFRFNNYFNIFYIFAYIEAFSSKFFMPRFSANFRKTIFTFAILIFCFLKFSVLKLPINGIPGYYRYYPYSSVFEKSTDPTREKLYILLQL